ncbi:MAG: hypothetical protein GF384_00655 [Elusimicrobia bacterium]|nr:hypothetical protein [Elusimicrobiota bacterium]MBD3411595.1 hypothetical protein [Elusimicrobiota bacterium]
MEIKNEFKLLIDLQERDQRIDAMKAELEDKPLQIQELNEKLEEKHAAFEALKTETKQAGLRHKEKEGELQNKEKEIQKFNQELNSIKTNEAYKAMLAQIEAAKKEMSDIEDSILEFLETADANQKQLKEHEARYKEEEASIKAQIQSIETDIENLKKECAQAEEERDGFIKTIPEQPLRVYEHIRTSKDGLAIVPIRGNSCTGCNYKQPPQKINEAAKQKEIVLCENCSRIIYYSKENA